MHIDITNIKIKFTQFSCASFFFISESDSIQQPNKNNDAHTCPFATFFTTTHYISLQCIYTNMLPNLNATFLTILIDRNDWQMFQQLFIFSFIILKRKKSLLGEEKLTLIFLFILMMSLYIDLRYQIYIRKMIQI